MKFFVPRILVFLASCALMHCARAPIKSVDQAMRLTPEMPLSLADDLAYEKLADGLKKNRERLKAFGDPQQIMKFGPYTIMKDEYLAALDTLIDSLREDSTGQALSQKLRSDFVFLEVFGRDEWGEVFVTSYFEPLIEGSLKRTKRFSQPLYAPPEDLVLVRMDKFAQEFPILRHYHEGAIQRKSRDGFLRGRLLPAAEMEGDTDSTGDMPLPSIVPYWTRQEIDSNKVLLKKKAKILAWVDPVDAFFLHIQGSGKVRLPGNKILRLGYAAQNGHPYTAIGRYLFHVIPKEEMSQQKIEKHLRSLSEKERSELLNLNSSYVFFRELKSEAKTFFGTEVIEGRTIATDQKYFPKGALAFLEYEKPVFANAESDEPVEFVRSSRFVFDHDTGGAIRGPGRVDLFWGSGPEAQKVSGVMRNGGRLYYLFPKSHLKR